MTRLHKKASVMLAFFGLSKGNTHLQSANLCRAWSLCPCCGTAPNCAPGSDLRNRVRNHRAVRSLRSLAADPTPQSRHAWHAWC